ncbi:hypothetical protein [Billgrantia gudaonensis]|uniref:Uncharacterized protein n=1 Tax=Billgrantia gudaonensis TaxID=376427 RepID=A0A1G8PYG9_9GAMM|nr:hypothetical protein [Halomonas gudaonensis]SDI97306.1 hypothetical protein SAMN04487954_102233 [Halomonas gudaonensis]
MSASISPGAAPPTRSFAVTTIAWGFIAFAAVTIVLLGLALLPGERLPLVLTAEPGSGGLTGGVAWLLERSQALAALLLAGAVLTLWLAIALLQRRAWARRAFLILLATGFVAVLGGAALTPLTFSLLPEAATSAAVDRSAPTAGLTGTLSAIILLATLLAALFAWAGWKLGSTTVRREFRQQEG